MCVDCIRVCVNCKGVCVDCIGVCVCGLLGSVWVALYRGGCMVGADSMGV